MARVVVAVALAFSGGCAGDGVVASSAPPVTGPPAAASSAAPVSIPLAAEGTPPRLIADVDIGGAVLHVLVDTGSSGLRVNAAKVPPGAARRLGPARPYSYASGVRLTGTVAEATIGLGAVHGVTPARLELVEGSDCRPDHPNCRAGHPRFDGIMGLGARSDPDVGNPLWSLGPAGHVFTVHWDPQGPSALVLGEPAAGFTIEPLAPLRPPGRSGGDGSAQQPPSWRSTTPVCFEAAALAGRICTPTLFDTGTPPLANIHVPDGPDRSPTPGFPITLGTPDGRWRADYLTAPGRSANVSTRPAPGGKPDTSVAGLPVFGRTDVRFDLDAGTIGFRPHR